MSRKLVRTRYTTGCGHSIARLHNRRPIWYLAGATTDCRTCGALLFVPREQFEGRDVRSVPIQVHMPLFHRWLSKGTGGDWPADGVGTGYVDVTSEDEVDPMTGEPVIHCIVINSKGNDES